jgi:hypothetical protein
MHFFQRGRNLHDLTKDMPRHCHRVFMNNIFDFRFNVVQLYSEPNETSSIMIIIFRLSFSRLYLIRMCLKFFFNK